MPQMLATPLLTESKTFFELMYEERYRRIEGVAPEARRQAASEPAVTSHQLVAVS